MDLIDTIVCIECGKREYARSKGKSARVQNGVCDVCQPKLFGGVSDGVPSKDGPTSESKGLSPRDARKG